MMSDLDRRNARARILRRALELALPLLVEVDATYEGCDFILIACTDIDGESDQTTVVTNVDGRDKFMATLEMVMERVTSATPERVEDTQ